ncbi:hypothetical protein SAMN04487965_0555 [Microbulbifer donghaiensis]|uniref:Uncharacterized protein n=1 Tax=Microbulbifer donghaiensis TaxID=494016 RepID=A0A1M4VZI7_9GAMM|nr:hypothetical protein [Microbulbifer donghaiensis]SHE74367.1 hypothetical protein SAMN04487965_0555 [Microbulbifer donghaiensis]
MDKFEQRNPNTLSDSVLHGKEVDFGDPDFDQWLSKQLQFNEPYLDNDGFCERVMQQLPAPTKRAERRATRAQYAAVVAASAIVVWQFPFGELLSGVVQQSISLYSLVGLGALASLAAMTGGILAARR